MKATKYLTILFPLILTLVSCGQKGKTQAELKLNVGHLVSSGNLNGGVYIIGRSDQGDRFRYGTGDASNVEVSLPNGSWNFQAIGWRDSTAPMDGENVCGFTTADLGGGSLEVSMSLSVSNCLDFKNIDQPLADANSFDGSTDGLFKQLDLVSCLTIQSVSNNTTNTGCNNLLDISQFSGRSASIRVSLIGGGNFDLPASSLNSKCVNLPNAGATPTDLSGALFNANLRIPTRAGSTTPFPIMIKGFDSINCGGEWTPYYFPHGLLGKRGSQGTYSLRDAGGRILWADNYTGLPETAFHDAPDKIFPSFNCTSQTRCFPETTTNFTGAQDLESLRDSMWEVIGSPLLTETHETTIKERGLIGEVSTIFYGTIGSFLYQKGVSNFFDVCNLADGKSFSRDFEGENGKLQQLDVIHKVPAGPNMPGYFQNTTPKINEHRLTILLNGKKNALFEFNCSNNVVGLGRFQLLRHESGSLESVIEGKFDMRTPAGPTNGKSIEVTSYEDRESTTYPRRSWIAIDENDGTATTDTLNVFTVESNRNRSRHARQSAYIDVANNKLHLYENSDSTPTTGTSFTNGTDTNFHQSCYNTTDPTMTTSCGSFAVEPESGLTTDNGAALTAPMDPQLMPGNLSTQELDGLGIADFPGF